jgi:UTP--glucose-1-phosphate uridylyltransferase
VTDRSGFEPFETRMRAEGQPPVAIDTFRIYWERLRAGETGTLGRDAIEPVESLPDAAELAEYAPYGEEALAYAVVIKLNGGLGTSMGMTRAKSLLPVRDGRTFLDLTAAQVLHLRAEHGGELPLVLMNSFRTRDDSLDALDRWPDLDVGLPLDFLQNKVPKVRADDLGLAEWPADPELTWCPPGHGDLYTSLLTSGLLDALLSRNLEYAFVSNVDNLGAVLDPSLLGWFVSEDLPFLMEACDRGPADRKGGHLARLRDGAGLVLREVAQCPPDELDDFQDVTRHRFFNTNNLWVNLRQLAKTLKAHGGVLGLPMIRNGKNVDPTDESSPRVWQLETAMGAALSVFEGARAVRVPRERFLPVKTTSDLLGVRSDAFATTDDHRLVPAPGRTVGDLSVDLDPRFFRRIDQLEERFPQGPPSLAACRRLVVRGDVTFGSGVVVRGDVEIGVPDGVSLTVPDGEVLG